MDPKPRSRGSTIVSALSELILLRGSVTRVEAPRARVALAFARVAWRTLPVGRFAALRDGFFTADLLRDDVAAAGFFVVRPARPERFRLPAPAVVFRPDCDRD